MPRGRLRVYLGVGPGVGATHAMLDEARRRAGRGTDVVVGVLELPDRPGLSTLAEGLPRTGDGRRLDPQALLARRPQLVVVDDLAEPSDPGQPGRSRWQDLDMLLDAGIDVVATVEVRAITSLADVVAELTGRRPERSVPDAVLHEAAQVELVDMTPDALRRRLAHGGLRAATELDATAAALFHPHTLAALRQLALAWLLDAVTRHAPGEGPVSGELHERIVVGLSGGPQSQRVLDRATRLRSRLPAGRLLAVHVVRSAAYPDAGSEGGETLRLAAERAGATFQQVLGTDVPAALLQVASAERATQVLVGVSDRDRRGWRARGSVASRLLATATDADIHVVATDQGQAGAAATPLGAADDGLSRRRRLGGYLAAVLLPPGATWMLQTVETWVGVAGASLALLLAVVLVALVGGLRPAVLAAVTGSTLLNYYFIPPVHTLQVAEPHNVVTLVGFVLVGTLVGAVVHRAASMTARATRATAESRTLAAVAADTIRGEDALPTLIRQVRATFAMTSASLLERPTAPEASWTVVADAGPDAPTHPDQADLFVPAGPDLVLALTGRTVAADDQRMLRAFAAQAQVLRERDRLAHEAAAAARLEATEHLRDALLAAVGHDLRAPLASATTAVESLRGHEVLWSDTEREELLRTASDSLDRLGRLVSDLLDLSRLRTGSLRVIRQPVWLDEIVGPALDELGSAADLVRVVAADDVPAVLGDAALITRALVNVLSNALRYSPSDRPPTVTVSATATLAQIRVVDHGPGIPADQHERVFTPFHRFGDSGTRSGLGLGLALSRGLMEALGGTLEPEETPSGGLTMVLSLPLAGPP